MQSQFDTQRNRIVEAIHGVCEQIRGTDSDQTAVGSCQRLVLRFQRSQLFRNYYELVLANSGNHVSANASVNLLLCNARQSGSLSVNGHELEQWILQTTITTGPTNVTAHPTGSALQQSQPASIPPIEDPPAERASVLNRAPSRPDDTRVQRGNIPPPGTNPSRIRTEANSRERSYKAVPLCPIFPELADAKLEKNKVTYIGKHFDSLYRRTPGNNHRYGYVHQCRGCLQHWIRFSNMTGRKPSGGWQYEEKHGTGGHDKDDCMSKLLREGTEDLDQLLGSCMHISVRNYIDYLLFCNPSIDTAGVFDAFATSPHAGPALPSERSVSDHLTYRRDKRAQQSSIPLPKSRALVAEFVDMHAIKLPADGRVPAIPADFPQLCDLMGCESTLTDDEKIRQMITVPIFPLDETSGPVESVEQCCARIGRAVDRDMLEKTIAITNVVGLHNACQLEQNYREGSRCGKIDGNYRILRDGSVSGGGIWRNRFTVA